MKHWKLGPVSEWVEYKKDEVMEFPTIRPMRVKMRVMGNGRFEVWCLEGETYETKKLLAAGQDDMIYVEYTANEDTAVVIKKEAKMTVLVSCPDVDQTVEKVFEDENWVNLEPRIQENPEIVRMRKLMERNNAMMQEMVEADRARAAAEKIEPEVAQITGDNQIEAGSTEVENVEPNKVDGQTQG